MPQKPRGESLSWPGPALPTRVQQPPSPLHLNVLLFLATKGQKGRRLLVGRGEGRLWDGGALVTGTRSRNGLGATGSALAIPAPQHRGRGCVESPFPPPLPPPHCPSVLGLSANKTPGAVAAGRGRGAPSSLGSGGSSLRLTQDSCILCWAHRLSLRGGTGRRTGGEGESQAPSLPWVASES